MLKELQNTLTYEQYNEMQVFDMTQITREFTEDVENNMPTEYINKKYLGLNDGERMSIKQTDEFDSFILNLNYTIPYNYVHIVFSKRLRINERIYNNSFTFITEEHTEGLIKGYILISTEVENVARHLIKLSFEVYDNQLELSVIEDNNKNVTKHIMKAYLQWLYIIMNMFRKLSIVNQQLYKSYIVHDNDKEQYKHLKSTKQNKYVRTKLNKDTHIILPTDFNITKFIHSKDNNSIRKQYTYTHAFIVRGHFRNLHNPETLGINMLGERVIKGKTWINSYMKNSKMQLINKTKVVSYK